MLFRSALGLALRAAGQGLRIRIVQFLKPPSLDLGERAALDKAGLPIELEALDVEWDVTGSLLDPDVCAKAEAAISATLERLAMDGERQAYDVLILDEIVFCLAKGLTRIEDIRRLVHRTNRHVEILMTGRGATPELIDLADLVTEMKNIKHPFDKGLAARQGIEY